MSQTRHRTRPDRRFGIVLIAVFTIAILGASLATVLNGGQVPDSAFATVHLTRSSGSL